MNTPRRPAPFLLATATTRVMPLAMALTYFLLSILPLALASGCGSEEAVVEEQAGKQSSISTLRRPGRGGIVFRATRDTRQSISKNPKNAEVRILAAPLEVHVAFAYDVHPEDVKVDSRPDSEQRYHAIVRPKDKTLSTARNMLGKQIVETLGVSIEERVRERSVLILSPAPGTLTLPASNATTPMLESGPGEIKMVRQPISQLIAFLRKGTRKPIVDETGLEAEYDFLLQWDPAAGSYATIQALRDLGLALNQGRRSVTTVVVTRGGDAMARSTGQAREVR
jgi:uncharacterized protein (TIGR03435 family)